ncbi:unnamed protein product [Ectocarpus fasciculatus]
MGDQYDEQAQTPADNRKGAAAAVDATMTAAASSSSLLNWSDKQSHILTGGGVSSKWYRGPRFPFSQEELPHFHKARGTTHEAFALWHNQGTGCGAEIAGAWKRPLFVGGWTHSDDAAEPASPSSPLPPTGQEGEKTFNLQTPSVFIDIRVPKAGTALLGHHRSFHTMTDFELRLFARRHAFAGYTRVQPVTSPSVDAASLYGGGGEERGAEQHGRLEGSEGSVATRHHCIDWNYVGEARPRPNKWRVEMGPGGDVWKEWGFAKDAFDQHVYMERWERLPGGRGPYLALRRRPSSAPDALLVVCGDHFGLIVDRDPGSMEAGGGDGGGKGGLVGRVDDAIARGDRRRALELLSLEASHGRVSAQKGTLCRLPWTVNCSLHPWLENRRPFLGSVLKIAPDSLSVGWVGRTDAGSSDGVPPHLGWNGVRLDGTWDVVENTMMLPPPPSRPPCSRGLPHVAFRDLFGESGAEVLMGGGETPRKDEGDTCSLRAKL